MKALHVAIVALYPDAGHIGPLLKIGAMLVSRGQRVTCLVPDECAALAQSYGFPGAGIGPALPSAEARDSHALGSADSILAATFDVRYRDYYLEIFSRSVGMVSTVVQTLRPLRVDALLVDDHQFPDVFAGIGAELGVPVLFHDSTGGLHSRTGPLVANVYGKRVSQLREAGVLACGALYRLYCVAAQWRRVRRSGLRQATEEAHRALAALLTKRPPNRSASDAPPGASTTAPTPGLMQWQFATGLGLLEHRTRGIALLHNRQVFGPILDVPQDRPPAPLEGWLNDQADRSVVYVSFGTMVTLSTRRLHKLLSALRALDAPALWVLGGKSPMLSGLTVPHTVRIETFVPQSAVLAHRAIGVCVTHGGAGTLLECMTASVPTVVMPVAWDQPYNAQLVHDLGVGLRIDWWRLKQRTLADAIERVRLAPEFRLRAASIARELRSQEASTDLLRFFWGVAMTHGTEPKTKAHALSSSHS